MSSDIPHSIEAYSLSPQTGQHCPLPAAILHCSHLPTSTLLDGVARADGTLERVSQNDPQRCLDAKIQFTKDGLHPVHLHASAQPSSACARHGRCRGEMFGKGNDLDSLVPYAFLVARCLELTDEGDRAAGRLCDACADELVTQAQGLFRSQWNSLPTTSGIEDYVPGWTVVAF